MTIETRQNVGDSYTISIFFQVSYFPMSLNLAGDHVSIIYTSRLPLSRFLHGTIQTYHSIFYAIEKRKNVIYIIAEYVTE